MKYLRSLLVTLPLFTIVACSLQQSDSQKFNSDKQKSKPGTQENSKYDKPPLVATFGSGTSEGSTESVGNVSGSATGGVPFKQDARAKASDKNSSPPKSEAKK